MKSYTWRHAIINSTLSGQTRHVLLTLSCHINDAGESAYPSIKTLAREADVSEPTVVKHLRTAKLAGWLIVRKHGYGGQRWARNEYLPAIPDGFEIPDWNDERTKGGLVPSGEKLSTEALNEVKRVGKKGTKSALAPSGKALNGAVEGTKPDAIKALNQVKSNYSEELPVNYPSSASARDPNAGEEEKAEEKTGAETASKFDRLWEIWPSHSGRKTGGRAECAKHWVEANLDADAELIIAHVAAMKLTKKWIDGYDPRPLRYLQECWWRDGMPTAAPAAAADEAVDWWLGGTSDIEDAAARKGVQTRVGEPTPELLVRVAAAHGRGPWIDHVLKTARKGNQQRFQQIIAFFGEQDLLPPEFYA